jgi:hypothetical protein
MITWKAWLICHRHREVYMCIRNKIPENESDVQTLFHSDKYQVIGMTTRIAVPFSGVEFI